MYFNQFESYKISLNQALNCTKGISEEYCKKNDTWNCKGSKIKSLLLLYGNMSWSRVGEEGGGGVLNFLIVGGWGQGIF